MIISHAELAIGNYEIQIAQTDRGHIYCFKHDSNQCDYEQFEDLESATDYIFSGLPVFKFVMKDGQGNLDS